METTSFLPSGYCHEGKSSLSSDLHRFQPIGLGFIFTSNNDGHFIGIEECSSVHKELDGSHIKRQTTVVAYFNRQKGEETFTRLLYGSLQACQIHLLIKHIPWKFIYNLSKSQTSTGCISDHRQKALSIDTLTSNWNHIHSYAFPSHFYSYYLSRNRSVQVVLIAFLWPNRLWFL